MRYARGEAILRVIAMRYAPQLIVSQNEPTLLGKSKTNGKAVLHMPFEATRDRRHSPHDTHARGVGDWPLRLTQQRLS
jgi:hypothetical protein